MSDMKKQWVSVCDAGEVNSNLGVRALLNSEQVAIFRVQDTLYAIDAIDPFTRAAVLSRGIVGDLQNQLVVASPLYKQHFNLQTGVCLEDVTVRVRTFPVREQEGKIQLSVGG